jgi:hypothetical protein
MKFILRNHRCKSPFNNKTVDIFCRWFYKKIAVSLPNSDETEDVSQGGLTAAFRLLNQVMKKEKPLMD